MGREGEREGEKHQCVVASCALLTGNPAYNPGMCLDWESTADPLICKPAFNPLSHSSQGFVLKILFIFTEKGKEEERGGEKHQCVVASPVPPTGDLACNPGTCLDWEWNLQRFGS